MAPTGWRMGIEARGGCFAILFAHTACRGRHRSEKRTFTKFAVRPQADPQISGKMVRRS